MASHRRPKQPSRMRVTVLTATAAAAVALTAQSGAQAAPAKPSIDEVKSKVDKLHHEAEEATEQANLAEERRGKLQKEIGQLQDKVARGQQELNTLRDQIGSVASAQYRSGGIDPALQLFLSADPDTYLDKASAVDQLGAQQADVLSSIQSKQRSLAQQRAEATTKLADLEDVRKTLSEKKKKYQGKLAEAQKLLNTLTAAEKAKLAEEERQKSPAASSAVFAISRSAAPTTWCSPRTRSSGSGASPAAREAFFTRARVWAVCTSGSRQPTAAIRPACPESQ